MASRMSSIEQIEGRLTIEQQIGKAVRMANRNQRELPEVSDDMMELARTKCIHVYNIGPWKHHRNLGSWGNVTIPMCPTDRQWKGMDEDERKKHGVQNEGEYRYVEMFPLQPTTGPGVPGVYHEPLIHDEKNFMLAEVGQKKGAMLVAEQILGIGSHMTAHDSWVRFGVFIGSQRGPDAKPMLKELAAAKDELNACYWQYFEDAEQAIMQGNINPALIIDSEHHRLSALEIGRTDVSWMKQVNPTQKRDCTGCGTPVNMGVIQCPQCRFVLDPERYDRFVMEGRIKDPGRYAQLNERTKPTSAKK